MIKLKMFLNNIKWKVQRFKRGYSDSDVWNLDNWFLNVMPKMLKQLKDNMHGCPYDFYNAETETSDFEKWEKILSRMIFLLREMNDETMSFKNPYAEEMSKYLEEKYSSNKQIEEDSPEMAELTKNYMREEERRQIDIKLRKKEFFELFSKYFYDLWD